MPVHDFPARARILKRLFQPRQLAGIFAPPVEPHGVQREEFHQRSSSQFIVGGADILVCVRASAPFPQGEIVVTVLAFDMKPAAVFDQVPSVVFFGVVVAERSPEPHPAPQQLCVGLVELFGKVFPVAAAPAEQPAVDVVPQSNHNIIGQQIVPADHLFGDLELFLLARPLVADGRKSDDII